MTDSNSGRHTGGTGIALPAEPPRRGIERADSDARVLPRFEDVFRDHFDFVWSGLRHLGLPVPAVDDAVQDVFLVVHRRLAEFQGRSALRTWLYGIVLRVAMNHRRKLRRTETSEAEPIPLTVDDGRPGPAADAERSEALRLLERLLSELDEDKREVLVLADLEQFTAPEIAELLGIGVNTVYSRLRAARKLFNLALARQRKGRP